MNRILVVDDDVSNLQSIRRLFLDEEEIECDFANSGEAALEKVGTDPPDLVILDVLMPGLDGYAVCRRIKADPASANTMVLLLSGQTALEARIKGYSVQADDYLTKPYEPEELIAKVKILLRLKRAQDELKEVNRNLETLVQQRTRELITRERQAVIGQLIQGIVHNFNGPLLGARGFAQLAKEDLERCMSGAYLAPEEVAAHFQKIHHYLEYIILSNQQLTKLANDLLVKSRKEASQDKTLLDLNEILIREMSFLEADMTLKHKVTKELDLAKDIPRLRGIYSDFSQVFYNLIRNAVDAMAHSPEKRLVIRSTYDNGLAVVQVTDSGTGIEPGVRERIFEPFFTTKGVMSEVKEGEASGSGLGLFTCTEILKGYGGGISVASEPGQGSCFTVRIPCPTAAPVAG